MTPQQERPSAGLTRRTFLVASSLGLAGVHPGAPTHASPAAAGGRAFGRARSTILFFLCGGSSHIDTWDLKPDAPEEYRGPFRPIATSAPGVRLCEHLPLLSRQAHRLAIVKSVAGSVNTNDHHAGYYYQLTGHVPDQSFLSQGNNRTPMPDDWPYLGCVASARRSSKPRSGNPPSTLPRAITLPHKPSRAPYTRPGQFAARFGVEYDPLYVQGNLDRPTHFQAPALVLQGDVDARRLTSRQRLRKVIDAAAPGLRGAGSRSDLGPSSGSGSVVVIVGSVGRRF